ncbi:MAG TPA: hypothetical protein ENG03_06990 [Thioploca sp.]|nr:MAG: hypothetical protein B6247_25285 [Beggiatoa sp. 4572_84]RKZ58523.1 MAG: hypothetical protein DRR08_16205 [Gammaproteobacteria bacterium]HDN26829.1 hypothetical protein [Thioploca sp.]
MHWLFLLILCVVGWPTILAADTGSDPKGEFPKAGSYNPFQKKSPANNKLPAKFTGYKNRYAFIVGITRYKNFTPLDGPAYDAVAVANILAERYGFTVRLLVDDDKLHVTEKVDKKFVKSISKKTLIEELDDFQTKIKNPSDSLLVFYYSGHGIRKVMDDERRGFLVPANGDEKQPKKTLLAFKELATKIANYQAHHTLLVLDACFSGIIFDSASQVQGIFQTKLSQEAKPSSGNSALERALARPVVQAITAGGGKELVADQASMSEEYMKIRGKEAKSLSKHSPFTALLIQSLSGRIGIGQQQGEHIPMGTIPGSMLGYEIRQALMDNSPLKNINQTPQYQTLAGDGDILLMPARDVLNPRLVGALYLQGEGYDSLRASGIGALLTEAKLKKAEPKTPKGAEQTTQEAEQKKQNLVFDALPHFSYALSDDPSTQVKEAALDALIQLVEKYQGSVTDFDGIISSLVKILNETSGTDVPLRHKAAQLLGKLPDLANEAAIDVMKQYLVQRLDEWKQLLKNSQLTDKKRHPDVNKREQNLQTFLIKAANPLPFADLEKYRQNVQWLMSNGEQSILAYNPIDSIKQFNSVINDLQGTLGKLEKQVKDTSSQLKQAKLNDLFAELTTQLEELFGTYQKYYERYPEYQRFYRRYKSLDEVVNEITELLPDWGLRFNSFNEEVHKRAAAIEKYFKQRIQKEQVGDFSAKDWQKEFQEAIQFAEQKTLHICQQLMLENKTDSEGLSNDLLKLLSEILDNWFKLPLKEGTWYYQSAHKILEEELREGNRLRKKLMQKCNLWTGQGALDLDWQMLYDNVVVGIKLVGKYRQLVKDMSPLIEWLKPKVEKSSKKALNKIKREREESKRNIQAAEVEAARLKQAVENTQSTLKKVEEQSTSLSKSLDAIRTRQQDEKQLLDALKTSVVQIQEYFCRQRGEACPQSASQPAQ